MSYLDENPANYNWSRFTNRSDNAASKASTAQPAIVLERPSSKSSTTASYLSSNDIQSWMQRVTATEDSKPSPSNDVAEMYVSRHKGAEEEARSLLDDWTKKLDYGEVPSFEDYSAPVLTIAEDGSVLATGVTAEPNYEYDFGKEDEPDQRIVDDILKKMMGKPIKKAVKSSPSAETLGLARHTEPREDKTARMAARHEMVKRNREKQQELLAKKRRETETRKAAASEARLAEEAREGEKKRKAAAEEVEIQQNMARIRRQLEEERNISSRVSSAIGRAPKSWYSWLAAEAVKQREQMLDMTAEEEARQQMEEERERAALKQRQLEAYMADRRSEKTRALQALLARRDAESLLLKQRCFSAWFGVVIQLRLLAGKVRAGSDWRKVIVTWNTWRAAYRRRAGERDAQWHHDRVKRQTRLEQTAIHHYNHTLLRSCLAEWRHFVSSQRMVKEIDSAQNATKVKMQAFLKALESSATKPAPPPPEPEPLVIEKTVPEEADELDEIFAQGATLLRGEVNKFTTEQRTGQPSGVKLDPRIKALLSRDVLRLPPEEFEALIADEDAAMRPASRKPSSRPSSVQPEKFEHRHAAHQKILTEQQRQIKDQQRLIEDLQLKSTQQTVLDDIGRQQWLLEQLDKLGIQTAVVPGLLTNRDAPKSSRTVSTARETVVSLPIDEKQAAFTSKLNERATQRAQLKAEREEKRLAAEQARLEHLRQVDERRRDEEEAAKAEERAKHKAKRVDEKRRHEARFAALAAEREKYASAELHHRSAIVKFYGWRPWLRLVLAQQQKYIRAIEHHEARETRRILLAWHSHVKELNKKRAELAEGHHAGVVVQRCFRQWLMYRDHMEILEERAVRHYLTGLRRRSFLAWFSHVQDERFADHRKLHAAAEHDGIRLLRMMFTAWRQLRRLNLAERERERRRADLRRKVTTMLPDFHPSIEASPP